MKTAQIHTPAPGKAHAILKRSLLLFTLLLAFFFRTYALAENPPGLSGDEGIEGSDALSIGPGNYPLYFPDNYGREPFYMYLLAACFKLFGVSTLALRYPGVLCGTITLALTYALLKRLWNGHTAWLALTLMAVSFWPVFTGRLGLRAVTMPPFQILAVYAMVRGLAENYRGAKYIPSWWLLAGAALGLGLYTYIPARIFPTLPVLWLILNAATGTAEWRACLRRNAGNLLLMALVGLLIFAPLGWFMLQNPDVANQRIEGVGGPLQALRHGDLAPILSNLSAVAGMVTFRGDPLPRYNIPGRPLLDWPTGLLWYAGLLLCLIRWREPRANLLLLWGGLMLTPTLLSNDAPSFLRATGALTPFYAMPALAIVYLAGKLATRLRIVAIIVSGLILTAHAWGTWNAYFLKWPAYPGVTEIYGDRLVQLGHYLDTLLPLPPESQVVVVCYYATGVCRDMLRMQTHYRGPLRAVTGYNALVLPAQPPESDLVYLFGHALPLSESAARVLQTAEVHVLDRSSTGEPQAAVYHLHAAGRVTTGTVTQSSSSALPLRGSFQGILAPVSSDLPADVPRGETRAGSLTWRTPVVAPDAVAPLRWSLALVDGAGNTWNATGDTLPYPPQEWQPGDLVVQELPISMPPDAPPGPVTVTFGLFNAERALLYVEPSGASRWTATLGVVQATGHVTAETAAEAPLPAAGDVALTRAEIREVVAPGETLNATLYWQAIAAPAGDYAVSFDLRPGNCDGDEPAAFTALTPLWAERYPTSRWQPGETLRSFHAPALPATLPTGDYALTVSLAGADGAPLTPALRCYPVVVAGRPHNFTVPNIAVNAAHTLSDGVTLLGYALDPAEGPVHPGKALEVTLYWQAQATPGHAYVVFVHLYRDGKMAGQHDGPPCAGACPSATWLPGEVLSDTHTLTLDPATPPGEYNLNIGLYDPQTLERLRIPGSAEAMITLQSVFVE
ncbi:MAG: glycosyltransferase family 39 protein [Anaerolineae bacterium]|nr:glycosyltransferase family 39 protein [Anaerolineae bacterium]